MYIAYLDIYIHQVGTYLGTYNQSWSRQSKPETALVSRNLNLGTYLLGSQLKLHRAAKLLRASGKCRMPGQVRLDMERASYLLANTSGKMQNAECSVVQQPTTCLCSLCTLCSPSLPKSLVLSFNYHHPSPTSSLFLLISQLNHPGFFQGGVFF